MIDFVDLHVWPIFNVADASIVIGAHPAGLVVLPSGARDGAAPTGRRAPMPTEALAGEPGRLDAVVARLTGLPRADVQRAIAAGRVTVDGAVARPSRSASRAASGSRPTSARTDALAPEDPAVPVRYRDEHLAGDREAGRARHPPHRDAGGPARS